MTDPRRSSAEDEALSALLDGELTTEDAERLRQRIARHPALAARLAELEHADTAVRAAYRGVVDEPLPTEVLAMLARDRRAPVRGDVVDLATRSRPLPRKLAPLALAAGVALAVGIALGVLVAPRPPASAPLVAGAGPVERASALHDVLETEPSGSRRSLGAVTVEPRLTFATAEGDFCRQIEVTGPDGTTTSLACRRGSAWQIVVATFAAGAASSGVYRPASGPQPAVDVVIDSLISGDPLDAEAERAAIARGWASAE
jgi:hypothetical protein